MAKREQEDINNLFMDYVEYEKFIRTVQRIQYAKGNSDLLMFLKDMAFQRMATVIRELLIHFYSRSENRKTIWQNEEFLLNGEQVSVEDCYKLCCKVVHINPIDYKTITIKEDKKTYDFIHKIAFIGATIFQKFCDKNDPEIKQCCQLHHRVNTELADLYGLFIPTLDDNIVLKK